MCELGLRPEKVRVNLLEVICSYSWRVQVIYHGNLLTKRDMTDVADSSRVMVDLIEVSIAVIAHTRLCCQYTCYKQKKLDLPWS